ncbi:hypothetical protein TRIUR3_28977 [Triticum urartu]|uniref:Uncharacterized protein n=2 Tax=Triticum TaxID=4564 RepID=A0A9R1RB75_TRITD|nr:hypothetical protein TRIUR3_28977 [Triticum urartu]VAH34927.1 unnamed protein product [Triticum turgidum subsp. durum]
MEAYMLFPRSNGKSCEEEQEEDIGCPSESGMSAAGSMLSSDEELDDDATSSSGSSGSTDNFQMSSLMAQLPLKYVLCPDTAEGSVQVLRRQVAVVRVARGRRRFARRNAAAFKKVSKGRLSALGRAPALRPLTASAARPKGLPVRAPLFV